MDKNIKDYREKELKYYVIVNSVIILCSFEIIIDLVNNVVNNNANITFWNIFNFGFGTIVFTAVFYIVVLFLDSLIAGMYKMKLIWFYKGMPGERIFSEIRDTDSDVRFTKKQVKNLYASVYALIDTITDNSERRKIENDIWYNIFKKHEFEQQVFVSHKDFLLFRDMNAITIWLIICFIGMRLCFGGKIFCLTLLVLFVELLVTWYIARVKGSRFVYNVIAADIHKNSMNN